MGRDQLGGVAAHLVGGEEEDAVPGEELAAIGLGYGTDDVRTTRKVFHQCVRRLTGRFRSRRVANRYDLVDPLGKARSSMISCWRHGSELDRSLLLSVVMAK